MTKNGMTMFGRYIGAMIAAALIALMTTSAWAQSDPRFVRLSSKTKGVLYMPDSGPAPHIGILLMHEDFAVVEGEAHEIVPCAACEKTKGQYGNTVKNTFDYMKAWIDKHY